MKAQLPSRNRLSTRISGTLKLAAAFAAVLAAVSAQDADAATLTWTGSAGAASNVWNVGTTANWLNGGAPSVFNNNDAVTFDGIGSTNPTVNLTATVLPASVTVNSASKYTFTNSGSGGLGGSGRLIKLGTGELILRGANTYSGGTTNSSSWPGITIFHVNALGTGPLTMNGGNLSFGANVAAGNGGRGVTNDIFMKAASDGNALSAAGLLSGKISGSGRWHWNGFSSGSVTLGGDNSGWSGNFNFTGPITLYLGHTNALGSGTVTMSAGLLPVIGAAADLSGGLGVTNAIVMSGNPLTINLTHDLLLSGPISGGSNFVKSGSATLILSGNNTFTGNLTNSGGTLKVGNAAALGTGVLIMNGGKLGTVAPVTLANYIVLAAGGEVAITNDLTLSGVISGPGALSKLGGSELSLRGANTYSGGTTNSASWPGINIFDANALGAGVLTMNGGNLSLGADVVAGNGGLGVTNDVFMKANSTGNALMSAGKFSGKISGPGNWAWNGFSYGSVTLSGNNSGWSGGFNLYGPITLYLGHNNALGSGTVTMDAGTFPVISVVTDLSGGLGVTNAIVVSCSPLAINLTNNLLLSGPISGSGNLVKSGSGALILGGNNPFTGGTTVASGTLAVNGRLNGTGAVMVASGATLGGTGVIAGPVTVLDGGTVNPGAGQLALGNLILNPNANVALTLGAAGNPANSSLRVNGNLVLDGNVIISDSGGMSTGAVYSVINYTGTLTDNGCKVDPHSSWDMTVDTSLTNFVRLIATRKLPVWKLKNVVNVQSFGATGDGLTDDTAAIQAALNYAAARLSVNGLQRAGAAVLFPSGTYLVSDRLTFLTTNTLPNGQGLAIRGEGMTNTILRSINETGSGLLYFDLQSPVLNSGFKIQIEDIGLQSARRTSLSGAAIEIAPHNTNTLNVWPIFRAVQINGSSPDCGFNHGIKANKMHVSIMDRVAVYGQSNGLEKMTAGFYYDYCYGPVLRDCFVSGARTGMLFTNGGEGTMLNRCTITNADTAIYIHLDRWNVCGPSSFDGKVLNSVICANNKGIDMVYKSYFTIANNTFARQGSIPGYVDITMEDVRNSFISENVFSGSESDRTGIKVIKIRDHGEYNTIAENSFGAFDTDVWLSTLLNSTRILANSNLPPSAVVDYADTTFFQPVYTNWLRSPHVSLAAAPSEEIHPWDVFRDGRRIVNVADYGATGDGTTDDSIAVSNALSAFVAELDLDRAAGLYFPAGTYQLSQSLKGQFATTGRNAAIFGDGMNVSTIDWRGASFLELIDTGVSATVLDIHHLRIATPSRTDDSVILSVNQGASVGTNRSFRAYDMSIGTYRGTYGTSPRYGTGIAGVGLKNPLFRNVLVENYESGLFTSDDGLYGNGLVLTNGIGFEAENLLIVNMTKGLNLHCAGGAIVVKNCHGFSQPGDVKISAGGGAVAIQGAHINSTNNLDISNASGVSLMDTLFLCDSVWATTNINSEQGTLRLTACTNVIVRNNEFNGVNTNLNPQRFSIRLGEGCQNVEIVGNHFGEGIGIIIPAGAVNVKAFENRFLYPGGTDIVCSEPSARILMLPGEDNPDLAAIWNLDEGAGTNVHGQCYGLDGVISGAAWVAGKYGTGLRFNGVDNSVTVAQYPEVFRYITTNFTLMAWVKPEKAIGGDEMSGQNYVLYPTSDVQPLGEPPENHVGVGFSVGTNRIKVVERTGGIFTTSIDFTGTIPSSEWTHVAVAYSNSLPRLYINGVLQAIGSASARIPHPGCWGGGSYGWYQGIMDDYRVFRRALSGNEIVALGTAIPKTWTGDVGANFWDINTSTNWVKTDAPLMPAVFNNGDAVTFDDLGSANPVVNLTATVVPAAVTVNSANDYTFISSGGGGLGGGGTLTKLGDGELNLRSANTYSGGTSISSAFGGRLRLFDANALGTGVLTMNASGGMNFGANVATGNGGLGVTNDIVVLVACGNNALSSAGKLSGKISGPGGWDWNGFSSGSLTLSGDNSGWSGGFNFSGPITLYLGHTNALGSGPVTMTTEARNLPVISAADDLSGGMGVTNAIVMQGNLVTINLTNNLLLSGPISGSGVLVKSGSATLILGGNNPFTGGTTVSNGTLAINGRLNGPGVVMVTSGATLGGTGVIAGPVTVLDGGTVNPGAGQLTLGSLTLSPDANLALTLGAPGNPANSSLRVNGNLVLDGNLIISDSGGISTGAVYSVINYTGTLTNLNLTARYPWDMTVDTSLTNVVRLTATRKLPFIEIPNGDLAVTSLSTNLTAIIHGVTTNIVWYEVWSNSPNGILTDFGAHAASTNWPFTVRHLKAGTNWVTIFARDNSGQTFSNSVRLILDLPANTPVRPRPIPAEIWWGGLSANQQLLDSTRPWDFVKKFEDGIFFHSYDYGGLTSADKSNLATMMRPYDTKYWVELGGGVYDTIPGPIFVSIIGNDWGAHLTDQQNLGLVMSQITHDYHMENMEPVCRVHPEWPAQDQVAWWTGDLTQASPGYPETSGIWRDIFNIDYTNNPHLKIGQTSSPVWWPWDSYPALVANQLLYNPLLDIYGLPIQVNGSNVSFSFTAHEIVDGFITMAGAINHPYFSFQTDCPWDYYGRWPDINACTNNRAKIRLYEKHIQSRGARHTFICNVSDAASSSGGNNDAQDIYYKTNSLNSFYTHQIEGGRANCYLFESWYGVGGLSIPHTAAPETKVGSYANLALDAIKYLKGIKDTNGALEGLTLTLLNSGATNTIELRNDGDITCLPAVAGLETGTGSGTVTYYNAADSDITALILSAEGYVPTNRLDPGQTLTLRIVTSVPLNRTITLEAFWNPQDPTGMVRDRLMLSPPNQPPTLNAIPNRTIIAGQTLTITNAATDPDVPPQILTFSLLTPPAGAAINATNGVFGWRPTIAQSPLVQSIAVKVADNGTPSLSATQSFLVAVSRPVQPTISALGLSNGHINCTITGDGGPDFTILASTNLTDWLFVWATNSPTPPFFFSYPAATNFNQRFYRVLLGP